jgi:hypothetical protein
MKLLIAGAAAVLSALIATTPAGAMPAAPQGVQAPSLVEQAACVVRRERVVRPNGRVVYRTVRRCGVPAWDRGYHHGHRYGYGAPCRMVRERIVRPDGRVVVREVRRCG